MAIEGAKHIKNNGIPLTARVTIHRHNVDDLERTVCYLLDELHLSHITTNAASYIGLCKNNATQVQLSVEQMSNAMTTLLRMESRYPGRISAVAGPHFNAKQWLIMEKARIEGQQTHPDCGYLRSCGGVFSKITVRADGVIVPCVQLAHIELGTINIDDLRTVWHSHPMLLKLRERRDIPLDSFKFCYDCVYTRYCRGSCPSLAYSMVGNENHPSPDSCLRLFLESGGKLPEA
jgi:SynChlorMet cassette radical SAM/SPASM protein ScmE